MFRTRNVYSAQSKYYIEIIINSEILKLFIGKIASSRKSIKCFPENVYKISLAITVTHQHDSYTGSAGSAISKFEGFSNMVFVSVTIRYFLECEYRKKTGNTCTAAFGTNKNQLI